MCCITNYTKEIGMVYTVLLCVGIRSRHYPCDFYFQNQNVTVNFMPKLQSNDESQVT